MNVPKILIIDDVPENLKVVCSALDFKGFKTATARSGESALKKIEKETFDLILLDVVMPQIDGFEMCRRLKANPTTQFIPIIFMTALTDSEHSINAFKLGAVDFVTKPLQLEVLLARIQTHVSLRQTQTSLQQALTDLQKAQVQLVQTEKMAALGQLMAGIAHEINNPVSFIYGNLPIAQDYFQNLFDLLMLYQQHYPQPALEIQGRVDSIDLNFLAADLPKILTSMQVGADRIQQIVLSLRNFSRLDETGRKFVDLHQGIDNTLLVLQHRLKAAYGYSIIEVIKHYGDIPMVECNAGQLNQVFMNVLNNAIDALEQGKSTQTPQIHIRTEVIKDWKNDKLDLVVIEIDDNGCGIDPAIQSRIFDPFFTAKAVGKGTGLGLSISYEIIRTHQGSIAFHSIGKGSRFTIKLPIHQPKHSLDYQGGEATSR